MKKANRRTEIDFRPMTLEEFNKRIDQSLLDSKNGNLIDNEELIKEIENWE